VRHGKDGVRGNVVSVVAGTVVHAGHSFGNGKAALTRLRMCGCELIGQPLAMAASCTEIGIDTC